MALASKSMSTHNQSVGVKIPHPVSTNFDDFGSPPAKRLKSSDDLDSSRSRKSSEDVVDTIAGSPKPVKLEVPDSENEDEEELLPRPSFQTDLEISLPSVRTDKEAIAEYEAARAAEQASALTLQERLDSRKWIRGKSSIYVDAFNLALETVLEDESHLFDEAENAVFQYWKSLSYEAQYLYVRLFLRKTATWFRVNKLGYYSDIGNIDGAIAELLETRSLPQTDKKVVRHPGQMGMLDEDCSLQEQFRFADDSDEGITTLEDASNLLFLDELKAIARDVKAQGKTKKELLQSLRRTSKSQSGLGWNSLKRSDTEESIKSEVSVASAVSGDDNGNRDAHLIKKIMASTGSCIRLSASAHKLFERVHLVFYRSTEWTEKSLTTIILARVSRRNFPEYIVSRSACIFPSRSLLVEFEASIRTQFAVDNYIEGPGPVIQNLQKVKNIFEDVYPRWKELLAAEQEKEDRIYETGEGAYLRRFSPGWVYTRIVHKGLMPLARFKEHKREHDLLVELLNQRLFHAARRGAWYQRKALLEEHYMANLMPSEGRNDEAQKRHWKKIALQTCEAGLQDRDCHVIYHYDLQKRIVKLEKSLKIPKRLQHEFTHTSLAKPQERTVEGIRLEKSLSSVQGRRTSEPQITRRGTKTIWVDEHEDNAECSVEAMCLSWYRSQGWKGYHSEGGIIRTLFGYLFADIIFTYVPNVFQTAYQTCPLDLHTDAFYPSRISEINARLAQISNGEAPRIFREVYDRESTKETCIIGIDWTYDVADLEEILSCFQNDALAIVCKVMAQEYQQRGGGIPDLFLWHPEAKEVMFSEVKSENDRLSDTQRLWIHVLTGAGIKVELCHAVAREVRQIEA